MYNAFKFKKDKASEAHEAAKVKPLYESNPQAHSKKMNSMSNNARMRREEWI